MAATTTETIANNFDHQLKLGSPVKRFNDPYQDQPPTPVTARPVSSRPTTRSQRTSFSDELPTAQQASTARPKTSHVSGRRRWAEQPPAPKEQDEFSPDEIDIPNNTAPGSPTLRPTTYIYR